MQIKKQQLELDMEQQTSSKPGKEYVKAAYCHPAYLTYMQSTSCKIQGWMKHKLESRSPGEISITSDTPMATPLWKTSLVAQMVKHLSTMQETRVQSLGWEDPLEKGMAIHSGTIVWKIPWTEEPGRLQPMGSQRVGHDWATSRSGKTKDLF